jgi:hypothetical protein
VSTTGPDNDGTARAPGSSASGYTASGYTGPPRADPPPHGWRTPVVVQPAGPRTLPPQDPDRLDAEEQSARTLTYGVAMVAGAVMVLLVLVLCGRTLF